MEREKPAGRVILCPHPGAEAGPANGTSGPVAWNTAAHRRKFLECDGEFIESAGKAPRAARLRVWCEYEPPTHAVASGLAEPQPRWVHAVASRPNVRAGAVGRAAPADRGCQPVAGAEQNTDPWIWADGFVWTICRHHAKGGELRRLVRELQPLDIVLFGSPGKGAWVLDTVLVVAEDVAGPRTLPALQKSPPAPPPYDAAVLSPLYGLPAGMLLRPVTGRPWTAASPALVSFAPSCESGDHFARPDIAHLLGHLRKVNGGDRPAINSAQSLTECTHPAGNDAFWEFLVAEVFRRRLCLGTKFTFPARP